MSSPRRVSSRQIPKLRVAEVATGTSRPHVRDATAVAGKIAHRHRVVAHDRDGGDGVRFDGESQIDRAIAASIWAAAGGEPGHHAGAAGAEVKREPFAVPHIGRGLARDGETLAFKTIGPERAVPSA